MLEIWFVYQSLNIVIIRNHQITSFDSDCILLIWECIKKIWFINLHKFIILRMVQELTAHPSTGISQSQLIMKIICSEEKLLFVSII